MTKKKLVALYSEPEELELGEIEEELNDFVLWLLENEDKHKMSYLHIDNFSK